MSDESGGVDTLDYTKSHNEGDEGKIPAPRVDRSGAVDYHEVVLYDPPTSNGPMLKWKCKRCGRFYADPKVFERRTCIPWEER